MLNVEWRMTRIHIRNLALRCIIGVYPEERKDRQDVRINVSLDCNAPEAGRTDCLEDAVDYKRISKGIISMVEESEFNLIETLAGRVADICLEDERVQTATVIVDKPGALRFAESVAVEVRRSR
jgi:dihydroneopterin aldolase/D-erythro-7,8-dihydroneopterin triphosphate epimerase